MHDEKTPHLHKKHRERVKERFIKEGISSFADHEILELLLFYAIPQGDTNPVAHKLLETFSTPASVFDATLEDLCSVDGIGYHSAVLIKLIPQLAQYYIKLSVRDKGKILTTHDAGEYICGMIGCLKKEVFAVICLDSQRNIIAFEILEEGTVSESNVHPRKVVEFALRHNSSSVILAHNHPGGGTAASENDRSVTRQLCMILEGMGIDVLDHIIAASAEKYISMADCSLMPN